LAASTKLLIHISDRDKWNSVLTLANRLMADNSQKDLKIVIIADIFAGAVCIACNKSLNQQMVDFVKTGQKIMVCEESIQCLNIPLKSLPNFVQPVPVALSEIIKRQDEGFHYIKV
jgi:intracellular sulfur oxidation DsrE/DsrF family protein